MVREIYDTELDDLLKLYLDLHEDTVPEMTEHLKETTLKFYEGAGYNSSDKTAFIQWLD